MTLNRSSKTILLVVAIASFGALYWRFAAPARSAQVASAAPSTASNARSAAPVAIQAPTPRARLLAAEQQMSGTPDSACAMPAPTAASGVDFNDPAVQAAFMHRPDVVAIDQSVHRIDGALRSSSDPFAQAVALWLDLPRTDDESAAVPADERARLLATMAASTTDPRVYALAFRTCSRSTDAACQALSARRWSSLDPGNAVPWLFLLNDAEKAGDASGQQEAWFHVANSARFDEQFYSRLQPILSAANDSPDDQRATELVSVVGIGIAAAEPMNVGSLLKGCRGAALADANRVQLCTKVADLLFDRSDAPMTRQFGASITHRVTGDAGRNEQVAREMTFWAANDPVAPRGCAELHAQVEFIRSLATRGAHGTYAAMAGSAASR